MVHIESFDSPEDMSEFIATLDPRLHPAQRALTFGQPWVHFIDAKAGLIGYGRVLPEDAQNEDMLTDGMLRSEIWTSEDPWPLETYAWRGGVWPIEERLFDALKAADWNMHDLDVGMQLLLSIAHAQWVAHQRSTR